MRKRHDEKMRAMHDAGNDRIRLAKVHLGMTRRVRQRHEHLPQTKVPFANVILHDRLLAREAMFVTKTLEDPLRRVPLLAVNRAIPFQNAVDDIRERRQLRALRRWRRRYPGGSECNSILATVLRSIPNWREASRRLKPSR